MQTQGLIRTVRINCTQKQVMFKPIVPTSTSGSGPHVSSMLRQLRLVLVCCHRNERNGKPTQAAMELLLRTSGAGRSWTNPTVFFKIACTPRVWKAACQTGDGVQGALWPLVLNLVSMVRYSTWDSDGVPCCNSPLKLR